MKAKVLASIGVLVVLVAIAMPAAGTAEIDESPVSADLVLRASEFGSGLHQDVVSTADGLTLAPASTTGLYLSQILDAPLPYNAMVPQWIADVPESASLTIQLRTANERDAWSNWIVIEENHDWTLPEDSAVTGQMIAVPAEHVRHSKFQYAVGFGGYEGAPKAILKELRLTFIDATQGPTAEELVARQAELDKLQPRSTENGFPKPSVVSRAVWCTDPACNYSAGLEYVPVTHLILHHTVSCSSTGDWAALMRAIWQFHTFTRGWGDIGYNYLVDPNGVLYEGHLGGDDVVGTHAAGANAGSMALSLMCNYVDVTPPAAMLNSAAELFAWKADQKKIDVFDAGYLPAVSWGLPRLMGHRDVYGTTQCPGDKAHNLLPWLRGEVASRIGFVSPHIYVDELSSSFTKSSSGFWDVPPGGCGFNGHAFYTWSTTDPSSSTNWGEWRPSLAAGAYEVQAYAPYCVTGRAETDGATYQITHANGTNTVVVSHNDHVGTWMSLGTYSFNNGSSGVVHLSDLTTTDSGLGVWYDAIRFRPIDPPPDPMAVNQHPAPGALLLDRTVDFSWTVTNPGSVSKTRLEVSSDITFSDLIVTKEWSGTKTSHSHTFDQDHETLYWRIVLTTTLHKTIISSATSFGLQMLPSANNQQPADNSWHLQRVVTFTWSVTNPSLVNTTELEVASDASFSSIVLTKAFSGSVTQKAISFGQDYPRLYWRVLLTTATGQTTVSPITYFGIDTLPPSSLVEAIYRLQDGHYFLKWSGTDAGSGVVSYNVDYRASGETAWTHWLTETPKELVAFYPADGRTYEFRSQAVDGVGRLELEHANPDIDTNQAIELSHAIILPLIYR